MTGALNNGYIADDARSHISQFSTRSRSRSEHGLFGQSQRYPSRNGKMPVSYFLNQRIFLTTFPMKFLLNNNTFMKVTSMSVERGFYMMT